MIIILAFLFAFIAWHRMITMQTRLSKPWPESFVFERRGPGQMMPAWYFGYSHWDMQTDCYIYAIMPINWLTRCYRWARWHWDSFRGKPPQYDLVKLTDLRDMLANSHRNGYEQARADLVSFTFNICPDCRSISVEKAWQYESFKPDA